MSECCSIPARRGTCPACGAPGLAVDPITPKSQLVVARKPDVRSDAAYFFCGAPGCEVVYFDAEGGQTFTVADLRLAVTAKDDRPTTRLCYCFRITKGDVLAEVKERGFTDVVQRVHGLMSDKGCMCERANPSGHCCVDGIKAWMAEMGRRR